MDLVWKLPIFTYNYAIINSYYGRSRQVRILGNFPDFSNPVWTSNKFSSNSKAVSF
jgi:hypothetical protein